MAQCSSCSFAFCIYCRQTYHGVSPCKMRSTEQRAIIEKYNNSEGQDRLFMEQRSVSIGQVAEMMSLVTGTGRNSWRGWQ